MRTVLRVAGLLIVAGIAAAAVLVPLYERLFPVDDRHAWSPW